MIQEPPKLPVYIVTSNNWTMRIGLDEFNAQFDEETQMLEAATRAVETLKKMREDYYVLMNPESRDENPFLGTTILVHLEGTDPDAAAVILTHICLGNTGFYKEAAMMEKELTKQVEEMRKRQQENDLRDKETAKKAQEFRALKTNIISKKIKPSDNGQ